MLYAITHSCAMDGIQFLQALLDLRGLNPNAMAKKAGNHALQSTVARFLGGNQSRRSTMQPVADFFGVDVGGFYDPDKARHELQRIGGAVSHRVPILNNTEPGPDIRGKVPLISWVQAGDWCQAADPHPPGQAERWMDCPVSHSSSTFALRVRGDSMTAPHGNSRTYPEGCFIFVDPEKRTPNNGDRVVACLTGTDEVTFKIYKNEDGRQWLQPLNPSHEPIRENFHIVGTVLGKWEDG